MSDRPVHALPGYRPETHRVEEIGALPGPTLLEFGTDGCGFCRAASPLVAEAIAAHPGIRHLRVEDGRGRPLGRAFRVKWWPTLVFLADGREVERLVRPAQVGAIREALLRIDPPG